MSSRIVVTGIGIVSSIGVGHAAFWKSLTAGRSGISTVSSFDTSQYSVNVGGEVKSFEPDAHIQR
ncbi:MAG: beta-ketoacyl-[acyl-carrier-protein] synthase II, partial [Candidatus Latescibacteria bacterium]|nr:beta-ketoacyl-[acyl-carrier-protein] synthase II [Candidatus Latescibacterota bacterium]